MNTNFSMSSQLLHWLAAGTLAIAVSSVSAQTTWFVDGSVGSSGNGSSWGNPMKYLTNALAAAADGDSVWVKGGPNASTPLVYYCDESAANPNGSDSATATFLVSNSIRLIGGFAGGETLESQRGDFVAHPVWLSGDVKHEDSGQAVTLDNYTADFSGRFSDSSQLQHAAGQRPACFDRRGSGH